MFFFAAFILGLLFYRFCKKPHSAIKIAEVGPTDAMIVCKIYQIILYFITAPNPNKTSFLTTRKKLWRPLLDVENHTRSDSHFEPRHRKHIFST